MPFPTVKSSEWPEKPRPQRVHLWSENVWRGLVLKGLLTIPRMKLRKEIAGICSFRFTNKQLGESKDGTTSRIK